MRMQRTGIAPGAALPGLWRAGSSREPAEREYKKSIIATWEERLFQVSQNEGEIS
jgi:hypothetical protein